MEKENDDGKELAELSLVGEIRAMSWSGSLSTEAWLASSRI